MKSAARACFRAIWRWTAPVRRPLVNAFDRHMTRLIEAAVRVLEPHLDRIAARGDAVAGSVGRLEHLTHTIARSAGQIEELSHAIARAVGTLEHIARASDGSLGRVEELSNAIARAVGTLEHIARASDGSLGRVEELSNAIARAVGTLEHIARVTDGRSEQMTHALGEAGRIEHLFRALHQKSDHLGGELNLVLDSLVREVARLEMQVDALRHPTPMDARDGLDLDDEAAAEETPDGASRYPQEWMKAVG